ncbi:MAG: aminotransferase class I/II-fold pyridoxal phosphate-dependent enzyme [bacterium]
MKTDETRLAIESGVPVRSIPWPTYDKGNVCIDNTDCYAAWKVIKSKLMYRYDFRDMDDTETGRLEKDLAEFFGVRYALALSSGTSVLSVSMMASGVGVGDEVLCSSFGFPASPSSILLAGAVPVLVEVDENLHIDVYDLRKKISPATKAILMVHMRAQVGNIEKVMEIAEEQGVLLIEDAVPVLGVKVNGKYAGTFGIAGAFSTQSDKSINTGEGGFMLTDNRGVFEKAVLLSGAYEGRHEKHCKDWISGNAFTCEDLAEQSGLHSRYVKEWLGVMVCGGVVHYDERNSVYCLQDWLIRDLKGSTPSEFFKQTMMINHYASLEEPLISAMRKGTGIPYETYGEKFYEIITDIWKPIYESHLINGFLSQDKDATEKMKCGCNVLEIGCGKGNALRTLSVEFPKSRFCGVDISRKSIEHANNNIGDVGNIEFNVDDAHELDYRQYDIVVAFDTIHDLGDPKSVLRKISHSLPRDGVFLMLEFNMSSHLENNINNPFSVIYYAFSLMHCIPVSFANGGVGLGATWGREETERMLFDVGFSTVNRFDTPRIQNCLYTCRVSRQVKSDQLQNLPSSGYS